MRYLLSLLLVLFLGSAYAQEPSYRLRAGDTVEIWVGQDPEMNRQVVITPDGRISLPLAGHLRAENLTLEELEKELKKRLQKNFKEELDLTAMLVNRQPEQATGTIYIVGDVAKPGEYPVQPGMTVLHAVSLAGGFPQAQPGGGAAQIDSYTAWRHLHELTAQEARLKAELEDKSIITVPEDVASTLDAAVLADFVRRETLVLESRRRTVLAEREARKRDREALTAQISALHKQLDLNQQALDLGRKELESTRQLMSKGLAAANRETALQRALLAPEAQRYQLSTTLTQAELNLKTLDDTIKNSELQRHAELETTLDDTQREATELRAQMAAAEVLSAEKAGPLATAEAGDQAAMHEYLIVRPKGTSFEQIHAEELTKIQAGDLINVQVAAVGGQSATQSAPGGSDPGKEPSF